MVALWILGGILLLFVLAMILPLKLSLRYTPEGDLICRVTYLFFTLYDSEAPQEEPSKPTPSGKSSGSGRSAGKSLLAFLGLDDLSSGTQFRLALREKGVEETIGGICAALGNLFSRLFRLVKRGRFHRFRLHIVVGSDDPADTAQRFGLLCAAVYPAVARMVPPKKQQLDIRCDFEARETTVAFDGQLRYRPWSFLCFLLGLVRQNLLIRKNRT